MDRAERRPRLPGIRSPAAPPPACPLRMRSRAPSPHRDPHDPAVRLALAALARGCDLVFPSRFLKRLRDFRQVRVRGGLGAG